MYCAQDMLTNFNLEKYVYVELETVFGYVHVGTGPGVDSASNRNEYQEYFLGVKAIVA